MLKIAVGSALLVAASHSLALSFGGTQGNVIIGRPLDMLVRGSIDASESVAGLCLEAQLNYGDTRVPPSAITLAIQKVGADGTGLLRVRSSLPVNEPVVSLMLKAGCENPFSRTYTLLSDFEPLPTPVSPVATMAPAAQRTEAAGSVQPAKTAGNVPQAVPARNAGGAVAPKPALVPSPIKLAKPQPRPLNVGQPLAKRKPIAVVAVESFAGAKAEPSSSPIAQPPAPVQPASRLQLDPIDLSTSKAAQASGTPVTGEAASTAPLAPDTPAPTDEAQEKMRALEQELKGLRDEQAKARQALEAMNAQLAQAQASDPAPWLYGLGAGLVLALGGWALWRQRSRSSHAMSDPVADTNPWWVSSTVTTGSESTQPGNPVAQTAPPVTLQPVPPAKEAQASVFSGPEDWLHGLDLTEGGTASVLTDPDAACSVEDLLDLVQQVDFFESLGQDADASETLEAFVRKHPAAGEVPYLLWMRHCMERGQQDRLQEVQRLYSQHFRQPAPSAASFETFAPGLDQDSAFLSQLSAAWPNAQARDLLEKALFSVPGATAGVLSVRTLESFEDLFLLHGVLSYSSYLQSTAAPAVAGVAEPSVDDVNAFFGAQAAALSSPDDNAVAQPKDAPDTADLNWATLSQMPEEAPATAVSTAPSTPVAPAQPHLLDFDLTELTPSSAAPPKPAVATTKDMPGLDFDFEDIKATLPTGKKLG